MCLIHGIYQSFVLDLNAHSEFHHKGRESIEMSRAVKSPSMGYHLMGCKKIQQILALPGGLEKFLSEEEAAIVRSTIVGHYSMEKSERDQKAISDAIANPGNYVLKPQREGGGNNIYDEGVKRALESMPEEELAAFIMMDIIQAVPTEADVLRSGELLHTEILSELGIYGVFVRKGETVLTNKATGHLLRSKTSTSRETGINAGFGMMDSIQLQ